jgi:protein-tyrosine phosphatase
MLDAAGPAVVQILDVLAAGKTPALVHCAAGKDRTGVAVAMLLAVAGVEPAAIVADYALTGMRIEAVIAALAVRGAVNTRGLPPVLQQAPAAVMEGFLDEVQTRDGGAEQWFLANGAEPGSIARWRRILVD